MQTEKDYNHCYFIVSILRLISFSYKHTCIFMCAHTYTYLYYFTEMMEHPLGTVIFQLVICKDTRR